MAGYSKYDYNLELPKNSTANSHKKQSVTNSWREIMTNNMGKSCDLMTIKTKMISGVSHLDNLEARSWIFRHETVESAGENNISAKSVRMVRN